MKPKITNHATGPMSIGFMAAARPLLNKKSGKTEYSIKGLLDSSDPAVAHLREVAEYKVDTKTNRNSSDKSKVTINFTTTFEPKVVNADGEHLTGADIPFFDGRIDTGTAVVTYNVIDYGDNQIVRLTGIKLLDLQLAAREDGEKTVSEIDQLLKASN